MTRIVLAFAITFHLFAALPGAADPPQQRRPNVLLIVVDDLRTELGCYGNEHVISPNIDRLAAQGTRFRHAYCQQALCAPSRTSFLTGLRPDRTGVFNIDRRVVDALPSVRTLPQHFRAGGYHTISLGKIYHFSDDDPEGWSERPTETGPLYVSEEVRAYQKRRFAEADQLGLTGYHRYNHAAGPPTECVDVPDSAYRDGRLTEEAIRQIRSHQNKPFFLAVGYWKPHLPFTAPKKYWDLYDRDRIDVPPTDEPNGAPDIAFVKSWGELRHYRGVPDDDPMDEALARELIHGYRACVTYIDTQVGRLLDQLERSRLTDKTIVVLLGDHGWKLGDYGDWSKYTNFEFDAGAPLILRVPGRGTGTAPSAMVEFIDIYPTLADLCGLEIPEHCQGTSMATLLDDADAPWKDAAMTQYPRGKVMGYSIRSGRWRYCQWIPRDKDYAIARELYDHEDGPAATENLAEDPRYADVVSRLSRQLRAMRHKGQ